MDKGVYSFSNDINKKANITKQLESEQLEAAVQYFCHHTTVTCLCFLYFENSDLKIFVTHEFFSV